uniref:SPX domain-containing protein n=1 Tax=Panagrellus redivivus TaxID=6233 RepID=A0A7E4UX21_PANRE
MDSPSPRDEFSLESERKAYEDFLHRIKKRSSAAVDNCMVELRMTLSNINEMLTAMRENKWRQQLWMSGYSKFEVGIFVSFQLLNFTLLSVVLHLWK